MKRCVLFEHSGFDADNLLGDLEERLEEDALHDLFAGEDDIDAHIARLCAELGVPPPGCDADTLAAEAAEAAAKAASPAPAPRATVKAEAKAPAERRSSA